MYIGMSDGVTHVLNAETCKLSQYSISAYDTVGSVAKSVIFEVTALATDPTDETTFALATRVPTPWARRTNTGSASWSSGISPGAE